MADESFATIEEAGRRCARRGGRSSENPFRTTAHDARYLAWNRGFRLGRRPDPSCDGCHGTGRLIFDGGVINDLCNDPGRVTPDAREKIAIQTGSAAFFAEVEVDEGELADSATLDILDPRVPAAWTAAALEGARWALRHSSATVGVRVTTILGMHTDTNAVLVALAAALATWKLIGFKPDAAILDRLHAELRSSWQTLDAGLLPVLERIWA